MSRAVTVKEVERSWLKGCGRGGVVERAVGGGKGRRQKRRTLANLLWSSDSILQHKKANWYSPFGAQLGSYLQS